MKYFADTWTHKARAPDTRTSRTERVSRAARSEGNYHAARLAAKQFARQR
jgi:hypothetical protein